MGTRHWRDEAFLKEIFLSSLLLFFFCFQEFGKLFMFTHVLIPCVISISRARFHRCHLLEDFINTNCQRQAISLLSPLHSLGDQQFLTQRVVQDRRLQNQRLR